MSNCSIGSGFCQSYSCLIRMLLASPLPFRTRSFPSLPSNMQNQQPPLVKSAPKPASDPAHGAAIIFLHGLDDDAMGWESMSSLHVLQLDNQNLHHIQTQPRSSMRETSFLTCNGFSQTHHTTWTPGRMLGTLPRPCNQPLLVVRSSLQMKTRRA